MNGPPPPPPQIPKGKLWASLAVPPLVTLVFSMIAAMGSRPSHYGYGRPEFLPVLPLGLVACLVGSLIFARAWSVRYRGRSMVLTTISFSLAQIILCLGLWFGCCLLVP